MGSDQSRTTGGRGYKVDGLEAAPVAQSKNSKGDVPAAIAGSPKKLAAMYQIPFLKHAPIGPTMALAEVRKDGTVCIYTYTKPASGGQAGSAMQSGFMTARRAALERSYGTCQVGEKSSPPGVGLRDHSMRTPG